MAKITVAGGPSDACSPDDSEPVAPAQVDGAEVTQEIPRYNSLPLGQLRNKAVKRGLSKSGSKADLVDRLTDADREA